MAALFSARGRRKLAGACAALWLASTTELAGARIKSGPGTPAEISRMILTSAVIPPAAAWHTLAGLARHRGSGQWDGLPELVLFDRDGTLIHDVPYNGDPDRVEVVPGAAHGLDRLRAAGVSVGLVTNQSAVGLGMITTDQAESVTRRVNDILGPFAVIAMCPHTPTDECECRKPNPGMVLAACDQLGVVPSRTVVVGDTAADVDAARAAGALGVLVPNHATDPHEGGDVVVGSLEAAVDVLMAGLTS